jgi:2-polyprenyl-3-methyl-5-hydroxy-6-metoxy-1,4-benzoquinol methylase
MNGAPTCHFCDTELTLSLIDLGATPLANSFVREENLFEEEPYYPLHVRVCPACRLVQTEEVTSSESIFRDYPYFSSYSSSWVEHACRFTEMAIKRFGLGKESMVVEIGSNDGYLLQHFVRKNVPVLGVEPAVNIAKVAEEKGVRTDVSFFSLETAKRLKNKGNSADLLIGNNVYNHVPDIRGFTAGMAHVIKPEGVISLEFPHLLQLIRHSQFDTIYHEHISYLSLRAVERIFEAHGLRVFDVEELPTHGGSLRVMGCLNEYRKHEDGAWLLKLRDDEAKAGLDSDDAYQGFEKQVQKIKNALLEFLNQTKRDGKSVAAYGAAAKGNTLLNYCGIKKDLIAYVVDRSPHKQGRYLPGSHLPIHAPEKLFETKPDYILILPWNLKDEICHDMAEAKTWGGKFVVTMPEVTILNPRM